MDYKYVQVLDNKIVAKFTDREMAFIETTLDIDWIGYPELRLHWHT